MKRIAYLGWLGAGNLGDDGCYELFSRCVRAFSPNIACVPITIRDSKGMLFARRAGAGPQSLEPWQPELYDYVVLGGGSLLNAGRYVEALVQAQAAGVPTAVWGTGFDGLPHEVVPQLLSGRKLPPKAREAAPVPHPAMAQVLRSCRAAGVRGPVTAAWLQANGCEPPRASGDPGLLLGLFEPGRPEILESHGSPRFCANPESAENAQIREIPTPPDIPWAQETLEGPATEEPAPFETPQAPTPASAPESSPACAPAPAAGSRPAESTQDRITVIWGASRAATHAGTTHEALTGAVAGWLKKAAGDFRPIICAVWSHDVPWARELATLVGEGVAEFPDAPLTLGAFRALMQRSVLTLSYRLHGCIFSAACNTPFGSVAYRSKCYDFAHSIGAGSWVVEPGDPEFEERLDSLLALRTSGRGGSEFDQVSKNISRHREALLQIVRQITRELEEGR